MPKYKVNGYNYITKKDNTIKPGDTNIWDTKETKFHPLIRVLGNTDIVFEKIKNNEFEKLIETNDPSINL